ncbi:MAG: hypothetical protein KC493_06770 [Bacteriovoracaceae bacterium]|nr:hypothetical protein [Bacteriovoracaceae bacterium]
MRDQVLNQFEHPWLMVVGMILFIMVFIGVLYMVTGKKNNSSFSEAEQLPLEDGQKIGGAK